MPNYKLVNADQLDTDLTTVADKIREKAELSGKLAFPSGFVSGIDQCSSLNFTVVGGTSQPSSPKENTIWVNTSTTITSWVFSAEQPTSPKSGMVWIQTGDFSVAAFNALKKNGIQVYPLSAKQYVNYSWVDKTAKSYQGGLWNEWINEIDIFNNGVFPNGGSFGYSGNNSADKVELSNGLLHLYDQAHGRCTCYVTPTFDFTGKKNLYFVVSSASTSDETSNQFIFGAGESTDREEFVASVTDGAYTDDSERVFNVDVSSLTGSYYAKFGTIRNAYGSDNIYVSRIYCT